MVMWGLLIMMVNRLLQVHLVQLIRLIKHFLMEHLGKYPLLLFVRHRLWVVGLYDRRDVIHVLMHALERYLARIVLKDCIVIRSTKA